jgi:hypothetical protein
MFLGPVASQVGLAPQPVTRRRGPGGLAPGTPGVSIPPCGRA